MPKRRLSWIDSTSRTIPSETALKSLELSQTLPDVWLTAEVRAKRHLLATVCLNSPFEGANNFPAIRKPFDVLAEGIISRKVGETGFEALQKTLVLRRL
jgi:hypothetical protein